MTIASLKHLRRLLRQDRGIAITEFGLIAPVFFLLLLAVLLITVFPEIATWLPQKMNG